MTADCWNTLRGVRGQGTGVSEDSCQGSVVSCQGSVVSCQGSVVSCQGSVVRTNR
jgi:hypothetical protein